jgi:hypothetical protein
MARKKKEEQVEKAPVEQESTVQSETSPEEQAALDEQQRQQRVGKCTAMVREALQQCECDLDITVLLKAGQVIPRVVIMPIEVLQAQRGPQK